MLLVRKKENRYEQKNILQFIKLNWNVRLFYFFVFARACIHHFELWSNVNRKTKKKGT